MRQHLGGTILDRQSMYTGGKSPGHVILELQHYAERKFNYESLLWFYIYPFQIPRVPFCRHTKVCPSGSSYPMDDHNLLRTEMETAYFLLPTLAEPGKTNDTVSVRGQT